MFIVFTNHRDRIKIKNILIIGGTGFIGTNIIEVLTSDDYNILLVTRQRNYNKFRNKPRIKVIEASLKDIHLIKNIIVDYGIEVILHLASNLIPPSIKDEFDTEMQDIVLPTFELLNFIDERNVKIIYFSSGGAIYGKAGEKINENFKLEPINYGGYSKLMIENHIKLLSRIGNLKYVILRPSNAYGKYQRVEAKQGFIAVALGKMLCGQVIEIWGDGKTIRDYVDVSDVSEAVNSIIKKNIENKIFNIGSGEGHSLAKVVQLLERHLNRAAAVIYKEKRKVDIDKMILDISSLQSCIDYQPKTLDRGIKDFIAYLLPAKRDEK